MKRSLKITVLKILPLFLLLSAFTGCMRYLTHDRSKVLLDGVDIDQTLKVAEVKMSEQQGKLGTSLPLWVIRDQIITPEQGKQISSLYFQHVNNLQKKFDIWHLTWAIADIYRLGDTSVKAVMDSAYKDASARAAKIEGIADKMVNGDKIYMGDAHSGGRAFAKKHVVVPGNKKYLQSYKEYKQE
jgi:hypothetical protein